MHENQHFSYSEEKLPSQTERILNKLSWNQYGIILSNIGKQVHRLII